MHISRKLIICTFLSTCLWSFQAQSATNFLEFGDDDFGRNFKEKSTWIMKAGADYIQYPVSLPTFVGQHDKFTVGDIDSINASTVTVGRDFYLGGGVSTAFFVGGFFGDNKAIRVGKAAADIDLDFSNTTSNYKTSGYEASVAINYIFDYKVVDVQPFIEVGARA